MMNKRKIIQFFLVGISTAAILEFYQLNIPHIAKVVVAVLLIVVNNVYSYHTGMKDGIEMSDSRNAKMNELKEQSLNKIVDMVVEEKTNDKAVE